MRGKLFFFGLLLTSITGFSQVGIGTTLPNASSQLEITATDKGILIPRVALTGPDDRATISGGNVTSLLVYNTATATGIVPGFYYWNGRKWQQILNGDDIIALDSTNDAFVNNTTRNAVELTTKSDGISARDINTNFVILDTGNVGIGTATPNISSLLDINAPNKGILIPRISLRSISDTNTISGGNSTSLLVYNTATIANVTPGFYYWDALKWNRIINQDDLDAVENSVDLRLVGGESHITKDAGVGGNGTSAGTGIKNIFIGAETGFNNASGNGNIFLGDRAGRANTTGASNNFIGREAGLNNTTGYGNSFIGRGAGLSNTIGNTNIFLGLLAGGNNVEGDRNIFIGDRVGYNNGTNGNDNVFIGNAAGHENNGAHNTFIGTNAGRSNTDGSFNLAIGNQAGYSNTTDSGNSNIGYQAGRRFISGANNTNLGYRAGFGGVDATGGNNVNIGANTGLELTTGRDNAFLGTLAGRVTTTGYRNTFLGYTAGSSNTTGYNNTLVGANAASGLTEGNDNTYVGYYVGPRNESIGSSNTIFGAHAGGKLSTGSNNTFLGHQSGIEVTTGGFNVAIGKESDRYLTTGVGNISLGYRAGGSTTGNRNIVIGYRSNIDPIASNRLNIGNLIYGTGVNTGTETMVSNGSIGIGTVNPKSNAILDMSDVDNKGVYVPNVTLTSTTDQTTVNITTVGTENSKSLLVYNTATVNDVTEGYYYWNGSVADGKWEKLINANDLKASGILKKNPISGIITNVFDNGNSIYGTRNSSLVIGSDRMDDNPAFADDDTRMFFNKSNGAFRAGQAGSSTNWNATNVGNASVGFGLSTIASGFGAFAGGFGATASGMSAFAYGLGSRSEGLGSVAFGSGIATGNHSFAIGSTANASNTNAIALGINTQAVGANSFALGSSATAESFGQFSLGLYPTVTTGDVANYVATDRLFVVGNGTDAGNRSDALTILKNGNTTLNGSLTVNTNNGGFLMPKVALTGTADGTTIATGNVEGLMVYNTTNGSGLTPGFYSWDGAAWIPVGGSTSVAFSTIANVTSNLPGTIATDDFVFGSTQLNNDNTTTDDDNRMFFDKSKGAFRAGIATGVSFDDWNIGDGSVAIGYNTQAGGIYSVAMGNQSRASGGSSVAIGYGAFSGGLRSVAIGSGTTSGENSFSAFGVANGLNSVAIGSSAISNGDYAIALGHESSSETFGQTTLGYHNTSVFGDENNAVATDRLLVIGNGTNTVKSDALTMLKNGNTTLNGSLTVNTNNGGFLMPKVALTGTADGTTIATGNVEGLMVYNTTNGSGLTPGFYSWDGAAWTPVGGSTLGDLRAVGDRNHITSDAGLGGTGTSAGTGDFGIEPAWNIFIGDSAGNANTTGNSNLFLGTGTGYKNTSGGSNIFIGTNSGFNNTSGLQNYGIGSNSLVANSTGGHNLGFGYHAGGANVDGSYNTNIGFYSGMAMTTGSRNLILGYRAGRTDLTSGNDNILLGSNVSMPAGNNQLNIGGIIFGTGVNNVSGTNVSTGNIGIGEIAPTHRLHVDGDIKTEGVFRTNIRNYADYVFENYFEGSSNIDKTYTFKSLNEVEAFIKANKHLPGVTGINDLKKTEKGYEVNLSKLSIQTLEKVEELYLHTIEQQKKINSLESENKALKERLRKIEAVLGIK